MLMKQVLASQVQRESCALFSCQVRNLFLYDIKCDRKTICTYYNNSNHTDGLQPYQSPISRHNLTKSIRLKAKFDANFVCRHLSRSAASSISNRMDTVKLTDYDAIGFDLDNTLVRYQLTNMVDLEYNVLAQFLINTKGYASHRLSRPMLESIDFLQRGLIRKYSFYFNILL